MSFMQTSSFFVLKRRWFLRLWHVYWKQHSIYSIHSRVPTVYTTRYPGFHFEFDLLLWIRNSTSGLVRSSMIHSWTHLLLEQLTFQTTIRALSCGEIADDHDLVSRIKKLYDKLDAGTTPVTILMPWLPSWTMVNKLWSTKKIYDIIVKAVKQRQALLMKIEEGEKTAGYDATVIGCRWWQDGSSWSECFPCAVNFCFTSWTGCMKGTVAYDAYDSCCIDK